MVTLCDFSVLKAALRTRRAYEVLGEERREKTTLPYTTKLLTDFDTCSHRSDTGSISKATLVSSHKTIDSAVSDMLFCRKD